MCGNPIALTTNCSGMGTPEVALGMLCAWLKTQAVPDIIAHSYSASDVDPLCQQMLLAHGASFGPQHVFGDMLHQLPAQWVQAWRVTLQNYRDSISKRIEATSGTHDFRRAARVELIDQYGNRHDFRRAARVELIDQYGNRFLRSLRWFVTNPQSRLRGAVLMTIAACRLFPWTWEFKPLA